MPVTVVIAAAAVAVAVVLAVYALALDPGRRDTVRRNLVVDGRIIDQRELRFHEENAVERALIPAVRALAARARRLTPLGWVETLEQRVKLAGYHGERALERALALKLTLGVAGLIGAIYLLTTGVSLITLGAGAGAVFIGYSLPDVFLVSRGRERQRLIRNALPDTLDQLTISVEAGLGFDAALRRVADVGEGPLAEELRHAVQEISLGLSRGRAFKNLVDRTDVEELNQFAFAVQHAEEYGLPIAHVLRVQSVDLRIKRRQWAEEHALKIPVKILFPLLLCIFPTMFIVLLAPAAIRIARTLF